MERYGKPVAFYSNKHCVSGLELTGDYLHDLIASLVSGSESKRLLICDDGPGGFVNAQKLPSDWFYVDNTPADLPDAHDGVVSLCEADSVTFDQSGAIILEFKNVP